MAETKETARVNASKRVTYMAVKTKKPSTRLTLLLLTK